jgi:putative membrane protein
MMHWGGNFGMGYGGGIFMILFWVVIILGVVYLAKILLDGGPAGEKKNESARELLEKRFARGEISREEFEDSLEVLKRNQT